MCVIRVVGGGETWLLLDSVGAGLYVFIRQDWITASNGVMFREKQKTKEKSAEV